MKSWLFLVLFAVTASHAQEDEMLLDPHVRDLFNEVFSGELAKDHVIEITRHHRIQGSRQYRAAAHYVLSQLRGFGFSESDAYIESFTSDGKTTYQTWPSPSGWDITSAELRMVEPRDQRLVGYPEIAMSVITYSNAGDVTADLVWVQGGTSEADYEGKDVAGKFVLATGYGGDVHRLAVLKHGAAGVVCYLAGEKGKDHRDLIGYSGMWPRPEEIGKVKFGFNISNRQGEMLKGLLESGKKVVLHGRVSGIGLEPYFMDVVVATIRGTGDGEVVISSHLDHPKESANDNASGDGASLDIARSLKELIESGRLPRPRRTIRFLWVPEYYGTMAYIDAHPELKGPALGGRVLANINMDMVGANLTRINSILVFPRTPSSTPSPLNDVVENMATMVDNLDIRSPRGSKNIMNYRFIPFLGASDHMMFIDRKIPAMMFLHGDYVGHTSDDTPDVVDPVELKRCEIICAGTLWYLNNLGEGEAGDLARLMSANATGRLGRAVRVASRSIAGAKPDATGSAWFEAANMLEHNVKVEVDALQSILTFNSGAQSSEAVHSAKAMVLSQVPAFQSELRKVAAARGVGTAAPPEPSGQADARIPMRVNRGPIYEKLPEIRLSARDAEWYSSEEFTLSNQARFELVNFCDGTRTVSAIRNALSAEFGAIETRVVGHYLDDLVKVGVMKWKQ